MFNWFTRRSNPTAIAREIYGSIVASARQETFYAAWGVPDTREGRFEMLALHVTVVMRRLERADVAGTELSRALAETFMTDLDDNMREIGVSDLKVPAKVKRAAAALFDRHRDYGAALATRDSAALTTAFEVAMGGVAAANADPNVPLDCAALTRYTERLAGGLDVVTDADCLGGRLPLPWPAA